MKKLEPHTAATAPLFARPHRLRIPDRFFVFFATILFIKTVFLSFAAADPKTVTAAVLSDFPPLYVTDAEGNPDGLAVDILKRVAAETGLEVKYLAVTDWKEAMDAVRSGRADFIPGIGISADRTTEFLFSKRIETVPVSLFVRKGTWDIAGEEDLTNRNVAVIEKSAAWSRLKSNPRIRLLPHKTMESALFSLLAGETDAFAFPEPVLKLKLAQINMADRFKVVGPPILDLTRGWLFPKSAAQFVAEKINPVLERLVHSDEYFDIYWKWYGKPAPVWTTKAFIGAAGGLIAVIVAAIYIFWSFSMRRVNRELRKALEDQQAASKALRESEARYRTLFDRAPLGVAVATTEPKLRFVNGPFCQMFGYSEEECKGFSVPKLHPTTDWPVHEDVFSRASNAGPAVIESANCIRKDGSLFQCDIVAANIQVDGAPAVVGFFNDVTEKRTIIEEIRQSEKLAVVGQLAGGIAHDFNNQLGGILGYADLLYDELEARPQEQQLVSGIISAAGRAADLTKQMLAFARKGKYEARNVDLHELIDEVVHLLRRTIDKRIVVETHFHATDASTQGDPGQLQNALLNLALNARDAMPDGGTIRFETKQTPLPHSEADGAYICITVSDTGTGMSKEILAHAFEPFFTTKGAGKGTGMGLAAVYGTVKNHNGIVDIESIEGAGTQVSVYLRPARKSSKPPRADEDITQTTHLSPKRVLLVDDEDIIRDVVGKMLRRAGLHVVTAADGVEAVAYFAQHSSEIDIVLLDMVMPRMDGRTAYREMKAVRPNVKVLLCSGFSMEQAAEELLQEGVRGFVRKPFRQKELLSAIEGALTPGESRPAPLP